MSEVSESNPCLECRHVMPSGARCHSPALRGKDLCYYHARQRTLVDHNRYRQHSVALPPLEDRGAIQMAINEVVAALAARKIDRHDAGLYLYAIQIASQNLVRGKDFSASDAVDLYEEHFEEVMAIDDSTAKAEENPFAVVTNMHLPAIDERDTHEYDSEPPDDRPRTRREEKKIEAFRHAFLTHNAAEEYYAEERRRQEEKSVAATSSEAAQVQEPIAAILTGSQQ